MHFAWTFSSQPPQKHPLIYCSTYFQAHSHPITSFSFQPQHYFLLDKSFFSLESHLTGEPCDYFILSLKVARNYVLACMFCIVWCQQISIWNKQIERSIYLINQVWFFLKSMKKIKILNWGTGEHRDSFHRNKRTGTHWEGLNNFSYAKILCAKTMAIICIWFWYDKSRYFVL